MFFGYGFLSLALMVGALVHFFKRGSGNWFWVFIIIFLGPLGAIVYLIVEVVPELRGARASSTGVSRRRRIHDVEAAVFDNPSPGNYLDLAELLLEQRDYARARDAFSKSITPRTDIADPFYGRALCILALGDLQAALPDLEKTLALDPRHDYYRAAGLLANAYALSGRQEDAERLFQDTLKLSTLSETQVYYARFLAAQGRAGEARQLAEQVVRKRASLSPQLRRADRPWFAAAEALLRQLPATPVRRA